MSDKIIEFLINDILYFLNDVTLDDFVYYDDDYKRVKDILEADSLAIEEWEGKVYSVVPYYDDKNRRTIGIY